MLRKFIILAICLLLMGYSCEATHLNPEKYYQKLWCSQHKGNIEYVLPDNTRVDCLTSDYAVEVDFANKWAEAIGQSLHYADITGKHAGIVLIMEKKSDYKYYNRIKNLCIKHGIKLFVVE